MLEIIVDGVLFLLSVTWKLLLLDYAYRFVRIFFFE
jgi:hypothetical protein